jgi:hypothetical protein
MHRHMVAMLLHRANRNEDRCLAIPDPGIESQAKAVRRQKAGIGHRILPKCVSCWGNDYADCIDLDGK